MNITKENTLKTIELDLWLHIHCFNRACANGGFSEREIKLILFFSLQPALRATHSLVKSISLYNSIIGVLYGSESFKKYKYGIFELTDHGLSTLRAFKREYNKEVARIQEEIIKHSSQ